MPSLSKRRVEGANDGFAQRLRGAVVAVVICGPPVVLVGLALGRFGLVDFRLVWPAMGASAIVGFAFADLVPVVALKLWNLAASIRSEWW